jgi:hypothetical protein
VISSTGYELSDIRDLFKKLFLKYSSHGRRMRLAQYKHFLQDAKILGAPPMNSGSQVHKKLRIKNLNKLSIEDVQIIFHKAKEQQCDGLSQQAFLRAAQLLGQ